MNQILTLSGCEDYPRGLTGDNQYVHWQWLEEGIVKIVPRDKSLASDTKQILLSTGIHGNETAPIEMVAQLVAQLLNGELPLAVNLLVLFGNIRAIEQGQRYLDVDLNRLFNGRHQQYPDTVESERAIVIEQHVMRFFNSADSKQCFHFDMHTAIRGSYYQKFAVIPQRLGTQQTCYLDWLIAMGLQALVINSTPSGTFSSFTHCSCNVVSSTLELGKAKPFGNNDLASFSDINRTLIELMSDVPIGGKGKAPEIFVVGQELTKLSDQFTFIAVDDNVENFTSYPSGTLIATDGEVSYRVNQQSEWILFPNPLVKKGLRAGILLTKGGMEDLYPLPFKM